MERAWLLIILGLSPALVVMVGILTLRKIQGDHRRKSPVSRKICRYPGYSLSKEVEKADERQSSDLMSLLLLPMVGVASWLIQFEDTSMITSAIFIVMYLIGIGFFTIRIFNSTKKLRNMRYGLAGEQLVGHELTKLLRHGFYVFHDIELEGENVDHVVVGPPGVFAIETKYRRKPINIPDGHKVYYNGERLKFWNCQTSKPLEQSKRQSKKLLESVGKIFGINHITPVVVFPGWWIELENRSSPEVKVLNEKQAITRLVGLPQTLPPNVVGRLAAYFEERCCDVEV